MTFFHAINAYGLRYQYVSRRLHILLLLALLSVACKVRAQYDPSFGHYFDMETSFNPAAVGKSPVINITGAYAMDMAGYEHNPRTLYAAVDMPFYALKTYHGVGVQLMNDEIGLFTHQRLALQYALRFKLFGGNLAVGVQAGFLNESFDGSGVDVEEPNDPALATSQVEGNGFDMGMGLYYTHNPWYLALSVQHLNAPLIELGTTNELKVDPTYYFTGGYNIRLRNPFFTIHPSVLIRTDGVAWRGDVTGRLVYTNAKNMLYGGIGYSPDHSVTFMVGGSFHGVVAGYSYELYTSSIDPGNGSHELFVGYKIDINLVKKGKNKHKSVRIL